MSMYVSKAGQKLGPYQDSEIRDGLATGAFSPSDLGWREGMTDWQPLDALFPRPETPPPVPPIASNAPVHSASACVRCGQGPVEERKTHRFGTVAAIFGYILLIPGLLGLLFGAILLFGVKTADTKASTAVDQATRSQLESQGIPEPIIAKVLANYWLNDEDRAQLTQKQQGIVDQYKTTTSLTKDGVGLTSVVAGGVSIFLVIVSLLAIALGWLLLLKKRVRQCAHCGTIAAPT